MKKRKILALCLAVLILIGSFGKVSIAKSGKTKNLTSSIKVKKQKGRKIKKTESSAMTSVSIKLLDETIKSEDAGANIFISPVSIMYAFGMAENGAKGKSKSQIEDVVFGGLKTSDTNQIMCRLMKNMESNKEVSWNVANSVWVIDRKDVKVKKKYLKTVKSYYDAEVYKGAFNKTTAKDMNKWVKKNTKGMIPKIVDKFDKDTVMYLINAMAFEAPWEKQFTKYQVKKNTKFTNLDGSTSKVTMMNIDEDGYFELNGAYGFKKYYKGRKYAFVGIEMPEGVTPAEYISTLSEDPGKFTTALSDIKYDQDVYIKLPQFSLDYGAEMSDMLKGMGVTNAFDPDKANLYNMFKKSPNSNYYFTKVLHKTHIEVDKNGTKAAAVTAIITDKATSVLDERPRLDINLDHPFVYAIIDTKTNIPVFIGCMNSIESQ